MRHIRSACVLLGIAMWAFGSPSAWCGAIYNVSIDTSGLVSHVAGPFAVEAQFNDGSGAGDGNNTAILSLFTFGTGAALGSATVAGGVTGDLSSSISMTESSFFNQFIQGFSPGSRLTFQLALTTNLDFGGTPDEFSFSILDSSGVEIPTLNAANALIVIDIDSAIPTVGAFRSDTSQSPYAGGPPINIASPGLTPASIQTPEPGTVFLVFAGFAALLLWKRSRAVCRRNGGI